MKRQTVKAGYRTGLTGWHFAFPTRRDRQGDAKREKKVTTLEHSN
ncbi:MAG TPA: hypothetical protein VIK14_06960 [Ignavibacteria bacterium]